MQKTSVFARNKITITTVLIVMAAFIGVLAYGLATREAATGSSAITRVKKPAPDFKLTLFSGEEVSLADFKGRPLVINFWASWCIPCRAEAPELESAWQRHRAEGVQFLGIAVNDRDADSIDFIKEFGLTYPSGPDSTGDIQLDYGITGIPVTLFVDKDGIVVSRWVGQLNGRVLEAGIQELLPEPSS